MTKNPHPNNLRSLNTIVMLAFLCAGALYVFQQHTCKSSLAFLGYYKGNDLSFDLNFVEENLNNLDQANQQLIQYTRIKHLTPPSKAEYNLKENDPTKMKTGLTEFVLKVLGNKRNGTFIEAGANDGEAYTNTIYLEKELGWKGVLVECNPKLVPHIMSKHRKAWVADVCLAPRSTPGTFNFSLPVDWDVAGTIWKPMPGDRNRPTIYFDVQAMPLFTILAALGWYEIDFFSFDIEGAELGVLKTIPFDKLLFKVIIVEVQYYNKQEQQELKAIFAANNYFFVKAEGRDFYYVHNTIKDLIPH